jgi:hypothetical protein
VVAAASLVGLMAAAAVEPTSSEAQAAKPFKVSARIGWQQTPLYVRKGSEYSVEYKVGDWTVDYRNFDYVGPQGYPPSIDSQIYQGCKLNPNWPYAMLLGKVGQNGQLFSVGGNGFSNLGDVRTFTAPTEGSLYLRIHDDDRCLGDNGGSITVLLSTGKVPGTGDTFSYPMEKRTWFIGYNRHPEFNRKSACYGEPSTLLWHAGEDWGASINTPINAVGAGIVRYSSKLRNGALEDPSTTKTYPGGVVIIEHTLPDRSSIWSMYGHLDPAKITVSKGDQVTIGNLKIADGLIKQTYNGNDNTHLHWEMRYFFDGSGINSKDSKYMNSCSGIPGPGYTYPGRPDKFVANGGAGKTYSWTDPSAFVKAH